MDVNINKILQEMDTSIPVVDYAEYGKDWVKGYKNGMAVLTFSDVSDISSVKLYDENGNRVMLIPVLETASAERISALESAMLAAMMRGAFNA